MNEYLAALDEELRDIVQTPEQTFAGYYGMFRYHLGWTDANFVERQLDTGKRIRPVLCLVSCRAVGGEWRDALPLAAAIELVHNFSLIHDDIEDQSDERRGRPTVWKLWGLAQGLNAGDGLFMIARLALDKMPHQGLPADTCLYVNMAFDATTLALCHGQFLDLGFESRLDVTLDEYMQMIRGKTAALISASTRLGALLGCRDRGMIEALGEFGENLGLAFQITDDLLGIWGQPAVTGKSASSDILSRKKSLPVILGLNHPQCGDELKEIYRRERLGQADVQRVLDLLEQSGARERAQQMADAYHSQAVNAIDQTNLANQAVDELRSIGNMMTRRAK